MYNVRRCIIKEFFTLFWFSATAICNFDAKVMQQFVSHVLSTPACLLHLNHLSPEVMFCLSVVLYLYSCMCVT